MLDLGSSDRQVRILLQKNAEFWTKDRSLTALFAYVVLDTFVLLPFTQSKIGELFYSVIYSMILVSGVFAIGAKLKTKVAILALAVGCFVIRWLSFINPILQIKIADDIFSILFFSSLTLFVLWHIFKEGDVSLHRIQGAVAVYVIIGLIFSKAYHLTFLIDHNAFFLSQSMIEGESFYTRFVYFSYVTLTTLGLGDITPINLGAKSLVMIEGLIGQLFPAIMITRLVTLEIETRKKRVA